MDAISSLTTREWLGLRATLHAIDDRRFYCNDCLGTYKNRADGVKMLQALRENKSCFGISDRTILSMQGISFKTCPGNFYDHSVSGLLEAYRSYERGAMPFAGALFDQPSKIIEAFSMISAHNSDRAAEEQKKARLKASRGR